MSYIDANHIEEGYAVFIRLVRIIEEEEFRVSLKVGEGVRMCKKDGCNSAVWCELYLTPKALFIKLVGEGVN